ncbi:MAG: hypothetical protein CBE24_07490 [bacterium TMED264]|nr:MAG: hypothetical protein CBE24_07490 [bacterium TMED264]
MKHGIIPFLINETYVGLDILSAKPLRHKKSFIFQKPLFFIYLNVVSIKHCNHIIILVTINLVI